MSNTLTPLPILCITMYPYVLCFMLSLSIMSQKINLQYFSTSTSSTYVHLCSLYETILIITVQLWVSQYNNIEPP